MPDQISNIAHHLTEVKERIHEDERLFARAPHSVALLAVSKGQPIEKIYAAIAAGQLAFGENYLQEALPKIAAFKNVQDIQWHFIGNIQSNKIKKIAENFDWVQSVTSVPVAKRLNDYRPALLPPLNICLQVTSPGKLDELIELTKYCLTLSRLRLRGLMMIAPPQENFSAQRAAFAEIHHLFKQLNEKEFAVDTLDTLSMGMSNDMQAAIAEGATCVRIGTAIFGSRRIIP